MPEAALAPEAPQLDVKGIITEDQARSLRERGPEPEKVLADLGTVFEQNGAVLVVDSEGEPSHLATLAEGDTGTVIENPPISLEKAQADLSPNAQDDAHRRSRA